MSLQALCCNVSDVLTSFQFQLFQLICFLLLLLLRFILLLSLATAFWVQYLYFFQAKACLISLAIILTLISSIIFQKNISSPSSSLPGLRSPCPGSQHLLPCHPSAHSMDGRSGLCTPCSSLISKATKVPGLQISWVSQPGNTARSCILLTWAQAAPAGLHEAVVKGLGPT